MGTPARVPRLAVKLDPDTYATLARLAEQSFRPITDQVRFLVNKAAEEADAAINQELTA